MTYVIKKVHRPSYARRLRTETPRLWLIHATRGHVDLELQDDATLNWFVYAPDQGGWASTADVLISADDDNIYEFGDIMREHSSWSAGYGALGSRYEHGADEFAISIELAQTHEQEPFTDHVIDKLVWYIRQRSKDFGLAIPAEHITYWSQRTHVDVPTGFIGHDETANGRKTGKSDPGYQFPWDEVLRRVSAPEKAPPQPKEAAVYVPRFTMTDFTNLVAVLFAPRWTGSGSQSSIKVRAEKSELLPGGGLIRDTLIVERVRKAK